MGATTAITASGRKVRRRVRRIGVGALEKEKASQLKARVVDDIEGG